MPTKEDFESTLVNILEEAKKNNQTEITIISKNLHNQTKPNSYPNNGHHRMPMCCNVMRDITIEKEIIYEPPKGNGATLEIKYILN